MLSALQKIDWYRFLARPALAPPLDRAIAALSRGPVLITGAGGSIGSALALRLAAHRVPLLLLDSSESGLLALQHSLDGLPQSAPLNVPPLLILGDAADEAQIQNLFAEHEPQFVFHAAAYKHVPLLERQPLAAVANNIFATETVAATAAAHRAPFVQLSTDKAVNPESVLGATKQIAEKITLSHGGIALRLGNILGSSGSVAEIFSAQILHGEFITLTDTRAERYFFTLDEAVNLLIAASLQPASALLVPALSGSHKITALAAFLNAELAPGKGIPIHHSGPRPGDKLSEQFWAAHERVAPTWCSGLLAVEPRLTAPEELQTGLRALREALRARNVAGCLAGLCALVPDYSPSTTVRSLAQCSSNWVHA